MSKVVKAVTGAVSSVVSSVASVVKSVVKAVVNVVSDVINFVASPFMGLLGGMGNVPDAAAEEARQDGVLVQRQGSRESIPVVYGYRKVGGKVIFAETGSTNNKYLWVAYAFAEGPVEGINEIWLDDTQLNSTAVQQLNAGNIFDLTDSKYAGRVKFQWFPGVYYSTPTDSTIGSLSICKDAPSWNSAMIYNGVAVLFARYEWKSITTQAEADANPFSGNIPQVQLCLMGKKVSSLRCTGFSASSTNPIPQGTAGTENYEYQASGYTERYSTNPAECLLDYLRNPRYGKGLKNADIDWNSFYIAAAKCNTAINYTTSVTGPILTLNFVLDTSATIFSNVKNILANMRGYMPYVQGKYKLKIEDAGNPTLINSGVAVIAATFTKDNIFGDIQYTAIDRTSKYNWVSVNWVDPDNKWSVQQAIYPETETDRQTYINLDGGRENSYDTTFSGVTNSQIAKDFARLIFNKSRYQESCSFRAGSQAFELEPGDNVRIRSNILNFGDTPWRIISIKLNDDYTFDISCVRNPDFIYPYVTPNTPDYVLPPYVPVGSTIIGPTNAVGQPTGLYPPVTAPLPSGVTVPVNTATNPPTTITTGTQGGGVGGSTSTQNTTPAPPPVAPVANPLNDYVTIDRADYTYNGEFVYVNFFFNQPNNSQYKSLLVYYKVALPTETTWQQIEVTSRPGGGQTISQRIGPLLNAPNYNIYDVRTRVTYNSGELSTMFGSTQFIFDGSATADPNDYHAQVGTGWNTVSNPVARSRDDKFSLIQGVPQLTGGNPRDPRQLYIKFRQDIVNRPANPDIFGVKVYYKLHANTYWDEVLLRLPSGSYIPGQTVTLDFTAQGYLGGPGQDQSYDFIFRWYYVDGSLSSYQTRYMGANIESTLGIYTADPFYGTAATTELAVNYSFQTVEQGIQTGAIVNPLDMTIGIGGVNAYGVNAVPQNTMRWFINPPATSIRPYWRGVRVLRRPVVAGTNPEYITYDSVNTTINSAGFNVFDMPCAYDENYQYVVIPLVYQSGVRTPGAKANFGQAKIHGTSWRSDYPVDGNWNQAFNWRRLATSDALGEITTGFAQTDPTIVINAWQVINQLNGYYEAKDTTTGYQMRHHYQLKFIVSHITNFEELHIYRRHRFMTNPIAYNATTNPQDLSSGFWEKIVLTTAKINVTANYINIVNLKAPMDCQNVNQSRNTQIPGYAVPPSQVKRPIYGDTSMWQIADPRNNDEFIFVVKANGSMSSKALYYRGLPLAAPYDDVRDIKAAIGPADVINWPDAIYESPSAVGYLKTYAEAVYAGTNQTPKANNKLWLNYSMPGYTVSNNVVTVTKPLYWAAPASDTTGLGVI